MRHGERAPFRLQRGADSDGEKVPPGPLTLRTAARSCANAGPLNSCSVQPRTGGEILKNPTGSPADS